MHILNLMLSRGRGGIEQVAIDYAEALKLAGIPCLTVTQPGAAINPVLDSLGLAYTSLRSLGAWDPFAVWNLRRLLEKHTITHILTHGNRALTTALRAKGDQPLIAAAHNYKNKHFADPRLPAAFAITEDIAKTLHKINPALHIIYMPNAVRLPDMPVRHGLKRPAVIGSMGRFVAKKGFEVLIDAVGLLTARGIRVQCIIGGDGELREEYQAKIDRMHLRSCITLSGWVEDKNAFFDTLDLFILPSHHEPFGIVLIEAMARGVPVISTMSEGPREIIQQGATGLLSPLASADALADAIEQSLNDPAATLARAIHGRASVERDYTIDAMSIRLQQALAQFPTHE